MKTLAIIWVLVFAILAISQLESVSPNGIRDKCKTKAYSKGDEVVILIDGREAIVNSVYCNSIEVVYFNGERYCYETFSPEFVEQKIALIHLTGK